MKYLLLAIVLMTSITTNVFSREISELIFTDYDRITKVETIEEISLRQLIVAREAVMVESIDPNDDLLTWDYVSRGSEWELYDVYSQEFDRTLRCVYFAHLDDSSFSVYFEPGTSKMVYMMYEN